MTEIPEYLRNTAKDLIGQVYKADYVIDNRTARVLLNTVAPDKEISGAVDHYTVDTIKGRTYLLGLTPNNRVDFAYELESESIEAAATIDPETTMELFKDARNVESRINVWTFLITILLVFFAIFVMNIVM